MRAHRFVRARQQCRIQSIIDGFCGLAVRQHEAKKAPAAIAKTLGIEFRGHGLRRTAATRLAAAGIPRDHIVKVLNHVEGGARDARLRPPQLRRGEADSA